MKSSNPSSYEVVHAKAEKTPNLSYAEVTGASGVSQQLELRQLEPPIQCLIYTRWLHEFPFPLTVINYNLIYTQEFHYLTKLSYP